jgi:6-phosphogluconolactonase
LIPDNYKHLPLSLSVSRYASQVDWAKWRIFVANESIVKLNSAESNYSLLDKHLLSFGTVLVPEMCVHTIDPSLEGPPSVFAREYAEQLSREFLETPDRVSEGIPQFDVIILGLDVDGKAAGLAAPPTMSVA